MLSDVIKKINHDAYEADEASFVTVNVRPPEKVIGMMDVIAQLEGKHPASSMSKQFSEKLAALLMSSKDNEPIIQAIIEDKIPSSGATEILRRNDVIKFKSNFKITFQS